MAINGNCKCESPEWEVKHITSDSISPGSFTTRVDRTKSYKRCKLCGKPEAQKTQ